jgi:hypothetical protein
MVEESSFIFPLYFLIKDIIGIPQQSCRSIKSTKCFIDKYISTLTCTWLSHILFLGMEAIYPRFEFIHHIGIGVLPQIPMK